MEAALKRLALLVLVALLSVPALAQVEGVGSGGSSGGLTEALADALYCQLSGGVDCTLTGALIAPSITLGGVALLPTGTEINFIDGVTSALQTQLNLKAPLASPTFTGTLTFPTPFTLGATSVTADGTELNYVDGVTSAIQTQLNARLPLAGGTMTGAILIPNGSQGAPSLAFATDATTGIYTPGANISFSVSAGLRANINTTALNLASGHALLWYAPAFGAQDTGLARHSAAVIKSTNASTGINGFLGGGAAVASAAALPLPTGRVFHVTGTTGITSITATNLQSGVIVTLIFDGILTVSDGNNMKLNLDFVTTADDTLSLAFDGTNFYEQSRSIN